MWLRLSALALSIIAVTLLLVSGPGVRLGLWPYQAGFLLMRVVVYAGGAAAIVAIVALCIARIRQGGFPTLVIALALALVAAAVPLELQRRARAAPLINDVSTGTGIQPVVLNAPAREAFTRARAAAEAMGWQIVSADAAAGRIEAVATTFWFGFKDDVVVRITPQGAASRIDVRSKSRVGRGDAGTNARRIRAYLKRLQ